MNLNEILNWRYATKKMDPNREVPQDKVDSILESIRLTASSSGLQPYHVFVVTNKDIQSRIMAAARGQTQVVDCSHLLVFAVWDGYTNARIDTVYDMIHEQRGYVRPELDMYRENLKRRLPSRPPQQQIGHATRQAYIAVGTALIAAAALEVDSVPIEGFEPAEVDNILQLTEHKSVLLMPLGYRDTENDWLAEQQKVRQPIEQLVTQIK